MTDTDKLVERLKTLEDWADGPNGVRWYIDRYAEQEAAITRLQAEVERKDAALRNIAEGNLGDGPGQANYARIRTVARTALKGSDNG